jgi:hypothetical protein
MVIYGLYRGHTHREENSKFLRMDDLTLSTPLKNDVCPSRSFVLSTVLACTEIRTGPCIHYPSRTARPRACLEIKRLPSSPGAHASDLKDVVEALSSLASLDRGQELLYLCEFSYQSVFSLHIRVLNYLLTRDKDCPQRQGQRVKKNRHTESISMKEVTRTMTKMIPQKVVVLLLSILF